MIMCSKIILSVLLYLLVTVHSGATEPADCPLLRVIVPQCSCESAISSPDDIVINCRSQRLTSMPLINGSYSGNIYEFTLAINLIEELPDDAFQGLKIQRLDVTENKLTNISDLAFRGLESTLIVLKISGDPASSASAPFTAISNLTDLQEMSLMHFVAPSHNLEVRDYFQPFSQLLILVLDNWGLISIGDEAFRGLTSLKELTLSNHGSLSSYPAGAINMMASTIEKITVTQTGIDKLLYWGFERLQVLKKLVFSSNNINELEDECFKGLENKLEYLDLSFNGIPAVQLGRLQVLGALKFLHLQHIGLVSLPQNANYLQNKPVLQELNLAGNHLISIPSNAFKNLTTLINLELSQNKIDTMADDALSGLTSLESLHLDGQGLTTTELALPSLVGLTSLTMLSLENTKVSTQSWNKISQVNSLTTLKMGKTGITTIPDLTFRMMTNLGYLDLSNNQIVNINQETFVGPRNNLKKIYLTNNKLETFDACTFYNYSSGLKLDLYGNRLRCDCSLYWLITDIQSGSISFTTDIETCFYPADKNGSLFTSHNPSDFCGSPPSRPQCNDYYGTTTAPPTTTTTLPPVTVNAVVTDSTASSITISWTLDLPQYITHIVVVHTEIISGQETASRNLTPITPQYTISELKSNTQYQICVEAYRADRAPDKKCIHQSTKVGSSNPTTTVDPSSTGSQMNNNTDIGIIIGSVVGGLVLFGILVAIIYLVVIRKKEPKDKYPVQPRTFTRAELPTVAYDSKRYIKKKKDDKNDVSVNVISDGKTGPNIGRISAGSYQYLQEKQPVSGQPNPGPPYENDAAAKQAFTPYENDINMRSLPPEPRDSTGYYKPSFSAAEDNKPHTYSEINL